MAMYIWSNLMFITSVHCIPFTRNRSSSIKTSIFIVSHVHTGFVFANVIKMATLNKLCVVFIHLFAQ